ncbi:hypothetical protein ONZ51_g10510 [Trametes cubensis]|uniref:Uncharacterized protein n=1 Tax=Trametes cubensis TaxID=1111947 RepID=A0AAD7TJN7_9APHY|nr:hypothetical protein ONZ51_g10510 [Trametes cubensis]
MSKSLGQRHKDVMRTHGGSTCTPSSSETVATIAGVSALTIHDIEHTVSTESNPNIPFSSGPTAVSEPCIRHIDPTPSQTIPTPTRSVLSTPPPPRNSSISGDLSHWPPGRTTSSLPSGSSPSLSGSASPTPSESVFPSTSRTTSRTVKTNHPVTSATSSSKGSPTNGSPSSSSSSPIRTEKSHGSSIPTLSTSSASLSASLLTLPTTDGTTRVLELSRSVSHPESTAPESAVSAARTTVSTVVTVPETTSPTRNTTSSAISTALGTRTVTPPTTPNYPTTTTAVAVGALRGGHQTHVIEIVETCLLAAVAVVLLTIALLFVRWRWNRRRLEARCAFGHSVAGGNDASHTSSPTPRRLPYRGRYMTCDGLSLHASDGKEDVERDADYRSTAPAVSMGSDVSPRTSTTTSYINALCPDTSSPQRTTRALPAPPSPAPPYIAHPRPGSGSGAPLVGSRPPATSIPIAPALSWYTFNGADPITSIAISRTSMEEGYAGRPATWIGTPVSSTYLLEDLHPNADAIRAAVRANRAQYYMEPLDGSRRTYASSFDAGCSEMDAPRDSDIPPEYRRSPE